MRSLFTSKYFSYNKRFSFFTFLQGLEIQLGEIISQSFAQCPTVGAQLRLLEVFEGISSRELVQANLKRRDVALIQSFAAELVQVKTLFTYLAKTPPTHKNMPGVVSSIQWIHGLRSRIQVHIQNTGCDFSLIYFYIIFTILLP